VKLTEREARIIDLLIEGCEQKEIADRLGVCLRTIKAQLRTLFLKCGIVGGVKRVKLAVLFYRLQLQGVNYRSLHWSPKGYGTPILAVLSARPNNRSRTTSRTSLMFSDYGIESNWRSGTSLTSKCRPVA